MTPTTKKLGLLMLAAVLIAALFLFRSAEPEYDGKKLSNWLRQYALYTPIDSDLPELKAQRDTAARAIRAIGTKAVPYLVAMAKQDKPEWQSALVLRAPAWLKRFIGESGIFSDDPGEYAGIGFMILGTNAQAAIADVASLMADKTNPLRARRALHNLSYLGPAALPFIKTQRSKGPALDPWEYPWLITNNILPTVTTPDQLTILIAALDNPDDRIAVSNTISRIAPHLLTNSAAH